MNITTIYIDLAQDVLAINNLEDEYSNWIYATQTGQSEPTDMTGMPITKTPIN